MDIITINDVPQLLRDNELASLWLAGANARALRVAPCLADSSDQGAIAEARLILVGAVKRWSEAGSGAFSQTSRGLGPWNESETVDTRQRGGFNLWPSEIEQLQALCGREGRREAFAVDLAPATSIGNHSPICALNFGATYCSCAANLTGGEGPLYERMD